MHEERSIGAVADRYGRWSFHVDNGTKFKSDVLKLMRKKVVKVISATTKYHHSFTAFVERFNKTLSELLFKPQIAQGLQNSTKDSKIWVKYLYSQ